MAIKTFQGTIEKGKVCLTAGVVLPEKTKVYVVVPDFKQNIGSAKFNLSEMISRMPANYQVNEESFGDPIGKEEW